MAKDREFEQRLEKLAAEVMAATFLLEMMYVFHFKSLPDGTAKFGEFADETIASLRSATVRGASAVFADHVAQSLVRSMSPMMLSNSFGRRI